MQISVRHNLCSSLRGNRMNRTQFIKPTEGKTIMPSYKIFAATAALLVSAPAVAQDVKVSIGISGWTGFAPLTLASQAGISRRTASM